jgi:hypothetical protein
VVTLKHMLVRLLRPEYGADSGGRRDLGTVWCVWQPTSGAHVSSKLVVAHFCVSILSVELQSQGKPVAKVQATNMNTGLTRRPYDTNHAVRSGPAAGGCSPDIWI